MERKNLAKKFSIAILILIFAVGAYWYFALSGKEIGLNPEPVPEIIVYSPKPGEAVANPIFVSGRTSSGIWFFEGSFPIFVFDGNNKELGRSHVSSRGEWMTENPIEFTGEISYKKPEMGNGFLLFESDDPSGLGKNIKRYKIPIKFSDEKMMVKIFFSDAKRDPGVSDCGRVYPAGRVIEKTLSVGRAALEELLKGPTLEEKVSGFSTSIPDGVKIQNLVIEDGVAKVDFNSAIETGGSCRVSAIRAQIENTLKQFPTVSSVMISVNGSVEKALQP